MPFERLAKADAKAALRVLVDEYMTLAAELEAADSRFTELEARGQFIDRFLEILGWDVHNRQARPQVERDVVLERRSETEEANVTGRPDYRLRLRGRDRLPVEAKKPSVSLVAGGTHAVQSRTYGWSLRVPAAVLTNFRETAIYDATVEPEQSDSADVALIPGCRFRDDEYVDRFDELWERLSYDSVTSDTFYDVYQFVEPPRGWSSFDKSFIEQFRAWRYILASDIAGENPHLNANEVGRRTQRVLNALLFLRVCEDRHIGRYQALLERANANELVDTFREADRAFNASLFDVLDDTQISATALMRVVREMYWPRSKFAFGVLTPEILADLYEQYLSERVEIRAERRVELVEKPELTHAGGIAKTPKHVVDTLLTEAVANQLTPGEGIPDDFAALDLAVGSGVFPVALLNLLISIEEQAGLDVGLRRRAELAKSALFGVDLDPAAVEVTKLSVLLAVLSDSVVDLSSARSILPDLSDNFISGNSIVGPDFDRILPTAAQMPERRAAVAPLDLGRLRPTSRGFDAIVGNPPYIRIQTLSEHMPDQLEYFRRGGSGFRSPGAFNFDAYMLFMERALSMLKDTGRLGYIVSHRFTNLAAATELRGLLGPRLIRMVHFGEIQVFEGKTTYTALVVAGGSPTSDEPLVEQVSDLAAWLDEGKSTPLQLSRDELTSEPWPIANEGRRAVFAKMENASGQVLGDIAKVFVGVQTSRDKVYFIEPDADASTPELLSFIDYQGQHWEIERSITKPAILDRRIEPYDAELQPDSAVIFPYEFITTQTGRVRATPFDRATMEASYPKALAYLEAHRGTLTERRVSPDPGDAFWAYGRSQALTSLEDPKLIIGVLALTPKYAIDRNGLVAPSGGDGGPYQLVRPKEASEYTLEVLQAVMSHPAFDAFVASRGKLYRGSYIVHRREFLEPVPVPRLSEKQKQQLQGWVEELNRNTVRLRGELDISVRETLVGRNVHLTGEVNALISAAYGLAANDVAAISGD